MNVISELRARIQKGGTVCITVEEFNQLQAEWITRAQIDSGSYCLWCGGDPQIAEIAKRMGHRPDIAFAAVRKIELRDEKWKKLYRVVNEMMMLLGADGEINAQQDEAASVMTALAEIDGGVYDQKLSGD